MIASPLPSASRTGVDFSAHTLMRALAESQRAMVRDARAFFWNEQRSVLMAVLAVTIVGFAVRLAFLNQPMRQDEALTVTYFAAGPLKRTLSVYIGTNNHVFHSLLVKVPLALFGDHPWAVRLPAFVAGVLIIPLTYAIGRLFYSSAAGLIAAALVAVSAPLTLFSINARGYTMMGAALCALLVLSPRLSRGGLADWGWFVLITTLGFWTNPSMLYPFGGVGLWILASALRERPADLRTVRRTIAATAVAACLTIVLYLPVIAVSGWRALFANEWVAPLKWAVFFRALPRFFAELAGNWTRGMPLIVAVVVGVGIMGALVWHSGVARHKVSMPLVMLGWTSVLLIATHRTYFPRVWLYLLPVLAVAAGAGLSRIISFGLAGSSRRTNAALALAAILTIWVGAEVVRTQAPVSTTETGAFPDAQAVARTLERALQAGDGVTGMFHSQQTVEYYLARDKAAAPFLDPRTKPAGRLFVIAMTGETVEGIMRARRIPAEGYSAPQVVDRYTRSTLYWLEPTGANDTTGGVPKR